MEIMPSLLLLVLCTAIKGEELATITHGGDMQDFLETPAAALMGRTFKPATQGTADLEKTTLGKLGHLAIRGGVSSNAISASYQSSFHGEAARSFSQAPVRGRSYTTGAGMVSTGDRAAAPQSKPRPRNNVVDETRDTARVSAKSSADTTSTAWSRRGALMSGMAAAGTASLLHEEPAIAAPPKRGKKTKDVGVPLSEMKTIPGTNPPILYYDLAGASGTEGGPKEGTRVAVNYDLTWKGLTIGTSRMGMGVTGGSPYGFDVGVPSGKPGGAFIPAFNYGLKGMGVGTIRRLIVPPEYGYGDFQMQEIPPGSTLMLDIELLSVATGARKR